MVLLASAATFSRGTRYKVAYLLLAYADLVLTLYALGHGYQELNPYVAAMQDNPVTLFVTKAAGPMAIAYVAPAKLLVPSIAFLAVIACWNLSVLAGLV